MPDMQAISTVEFGGRGPSLHFAHANAYPPRCYTRLLQELTSDYEVWAMEQRPLWPDQRPEQLHSWALFAGDLLCALDRRGAERYVGAGHSLGAAVTMMAAVQRPALFAALVLVEPVLLPPSLLEAARAYPEQAANTPLVRRARKRRRHWADRQAAFEHFRGKPVFQRVSDEALWEYVNHGLQEAPEGSVTLRFPREWEAQIYAHPPLDIWDVVPLIDRPTLAIRGADSETLTDDQWRRWQAHQPEAHFVEIPDSGHLAPFERPVHIATLIRDFLAAQSL